MLIMGNYQRNQTISPKNIKERKAYLVGGGIASLSAAFYLLRDGHMNGENINIFENVKIDLSLAGNSLLAHKNVIRSEFDFEGFRCVMVLANGAML
jgi:myosin-crossreactive antigen